MSSTIHSAHARQITMRVGTVAALVVAQLLLIGVCLIAIHQNRRLRNLASDYRAMLEPRTGRQVPSLTGQDWKGVPRSFDYNGLGVPTLVYTISQACVYCEENWTSLRPLQDIAPARLRIVYVDTVDRLSEDYVNRYRMDSSPILANLDPYSAIAYQAHFRPQAELVNQTGRVLWTKVGKFEKADVAKVLSLVAEEQAGTVVNAK